MDKIVCLGCEYGVEPIRVIERCDKTGKSWVITRCSRERCGFNIDIQPHASYNPKNGEFRRDVR